MFHILYDGTVIDERDYTRARRRRADDQHPPRRGRRIDPADSSTSRSAVRAAVSALAGPDRTLPAADLEVALLVRGNGRRCFQRLTDDDVARPAARRRRRHRRRTGGT